MVFSLKQHIPPSGELLFAEVSLVLHRSHGQSKYAVPLSTRRRMYRSSTCVESWRFCPTAFLLRSGECLPRHPVRIQFSRNTRGYFAPHPLFVTFSSFEPKKLINNSSAYAGSSSCGSSPFSAEVCEQQRIGVLSKALAQGTDDI